METSNGAPGAQQGAPDDNARRVKDSVRSVVDQTREAANRKLDEGKHRVCDTMNSSASTLRRAADDVTQDNRWLGAALRKSAEGLESAARSIEGADLGSVVGDLNNFARRQPAVFLGASLALGFLLARLGKTAIEQGGGRSPQPQSGDGNYDFTYPTPET